MHQTQFAAIQCSLMPYCINLMQFKWCQIWNWIDEFEFEFTNLIQIKLIELELNSFNSPPKGVELLESIRVKVYVNIINNGTLSTINIIYLRIR